MHLTTGRNPSGLGLNQQIIPSSQVMSSQVIGCSKGNNTHLVRRYCLHNGLSSGHEGGNTSSIHCLVLFPPHSLVSQVGIEHLAVTSLPLQINLGEHSSLT